MVNDSVWVDNGRQRLNIHGEKHEEHQSVQEQKQYNDVIARRGVYDQSNKMKTIERQHQQIQSQYGDGVKG